MIYSNGYKSLAWDKIPLDIYINVNKIYKGYYFNRFEEKVFNKW